MKFVVEGRRLKVLTKLVRFLARYTESVNIVIDSYGLAFKAVNETRSAYVEVRLLKDFFCESSLTEDEDLSFQCKVDIKSLQMVFRILNLDRLCEKCIIKMDEENHKIKVVMRLKNHVHREFVIPFMENEVLKCPLVSSKMKGPTLKSSAKFLAEVFSNFAQSTKEATIWMFKDNIRFKSFIEKDAANFNEVPSTNFTYLAGDFSAFNFVSSFSVTCNIKDVKSFIEFACHQNQLINTYIRNDSSPIELNFNCTSDCYTGRVILATFEFDSSTQPEPPPFNPSQRSSLQSQQTCTTLNYTMSSSIMSPAHNDLPPTAQNDSVSFSINTPSNNSTSQQGVSENVNAIIENLPNLSDPQDDEDSPIEYLIDYEGTQLREYHQRFLFGLDSQEKNRVNLADLETIVSESEESETEI